MNNSLTRLFLLFRNTAHVAASLWMAALPLSAQDGGHGFKEGQKIQWKDRISGQWQDGTFLYETPGGKQPVIQQRPGDAGSQTAYNWDSVRQPMAVKKSAAAPAAGHGFKAGQMIQWKDRITGKWEHGEYVGETPGGKQPIILQKSGDAGSQTAWTWDGLKGTTDDDVAVAPPAATPKPAPGMPAAPAKPANPNPPAPGAGPAAADGAPLTEDDIKKYFVDRIPGKWSDDPEKFRQVKAELDNLIKKRGTAFIYNTGLNKFGTWLGENGMGYNGPISHNYGPPNNQDWLFGSWDTSITGLPVRWVEGDKLYTWNEIGASGTGRVTINKDGTYRWNTKSAQGVIEGKWHAASADEMGDQGGAGVVLENAKNGEPWVAFKYRASNPGEEWLGLAEVNRRSVREGAMRVPAGQEGKVKAGGD
jgi:hypothetical protein